MKLIIGLTGLLGSGKSVVANEFQKLGIDIIDTDIISHEITSNNGIAIDKIRKSFGPKYINSDNSLNRAEMRNLIFSAKSARLELENILHPLILSETYSLLAKSTSTYTIVAVPLLFKALKYMSFIHRSIFVDCNRNTIVSRVIERNGLSKTQIHAILDSQVARKTQLLLCDDILDNNKTLNEMYNNVLRLDNKYRNFYKT